MLAQRRDLLPVRDLLLLAEFDGRQEGYRIPEYALEDFGHDYPKRLTRLEAGGYLTFAAPQDALKSLTIPKLKEILRERYIKKYEQIDNDAKRAVRKIMKNARKKHNREMQNFYNSMSALNKFAK